MGQEHFGNGAFLRQERFGNRKFVGPILNLAFDNFGNITDTKTVLEPNIHLCKHSIKVALSCINIYICMRPPLTVRKFN